MVLYQLRPSEQPKIVNVDGWIVAGNLYNIVIKVLPASQKALGSNRVLLINQATKWKIFVFMIPNESAKMKEMFEVESRPFRALVPGLPPSQTAETDVIGTFVQP